MSSSLSTEDLKQKLLRFESPFSWDLPTIEQSKVDQVLIKNLEKCNNIKEENQFKWSRYVLQLVLSRELWQSLGDIVGALANISSCCEHLDQLREEGCVEPLYQSIKGALWHVALATKAHLQLVNKTNKREVLLTISSIPAELTVSERAALWGIKAAVFKQYQPNGSKLALGFAEIAIFINPYQAEWIFIRANCFGIIRRMEGTSITQDEIQQMEHAYSLERNATYACHLAQVYVDFICHIYHNRYDPKICASPHVGFEMIRAYASSAVLLYKEGLSMRPDCPLLKVRVAHGLLRIPDQMTTDVHLAKQLLDEANVHLPSNSMLHHDLGQYYDKFAKDPMRAILCMEQAHMLDNYKSFLYYIRLLWRHSDKAKLIPKITAALDQYKYDVCTAELLVHLGACHLLINNDWNAAVKCFNRSLELDPDAKYMERFCGFVWRGPKPNILEIVINELRQKVQEEDSKHYIFQSFLQSVSNKHQSILNKPIIPRLYSEFKQKQMVKHFYYHVV